MDYPRLRLKKGKEKRLLSGHPWVYRTEVDAVRGPAEPGDVVAVETHRGKFLGLGYYNPHSAIAVRMLSQDPKERIDALFFARRVEEALLFRLRLFKEEETNAFRVVFGEADFLPGLIVDKFGPYLVVQVLTLGMEKRKREVLEALVSILRPLGVYERSDVEVRKKEGLELRSGCLWGSFDPRIIIRENGLSFVVDVAEGQKTGHFLDQRENRLALRRYVQEARVLDCFSYSGGFGIHALVFGAREVVAIDISERALALAWDNARLNGVGGAITFLAADVFETLREFAKQKERFDLVILDPPAFVKERETLAGALRGYKDINLFAMKLLNSSGILITSSCSHHLSEEKFLATIEEAASDAGRRLQVLERRGQAQDHPVLLGYPESRYLKCFILRVL